MKNIRTMKARFGNSSAPLVDPFVKLQSTTHFCENFYLAQNRDVALSGVDPYNHYKTYGWREGRDPSPVFSTAHYLKQAQVSKTAGEDPLTHYFSKGRTQGFTPHPVFRDLRKEEIHVGIVTVSYNCSSDAELTVRCVDAAAGNVKITYYLIDGGSNSAEKAAISQFCANYQTKRVELKFIDVETNLGYSGANNIGINQALSDGVTHVCLLNPDVIVTDYWLERMIAEGGPFISAVSNAVGNEQTIPFNYEAERNFSAFSVVNEFSRKFTAAFCEKIVSTEYIGFFCALIRREVIESIGLLDEQFFPGGFEDLDYCLRARNSGFDLWIARHIYLHHWGSASFSKLPMVNRITHVNENRAKFERKHGIKWIDWKHTVFRSAIQDGSRKRAGVSPKIKKFQDDLLQRHTDTCEQLIREVMDDSTQVLQYLQVKNDEVARSLDFLDMANAKNSELLSLIEKLDASYEVPLRLRGALSSKTVTNSTRAVTNFLNKEEYTSNRELYSRYYYAVGRHLILQHRPHFWALPLLLPAINALASLGTEPVVIFANGIDPIHGDEKDGYVQRIIAIDRLFSGRPRIYVRFREDHEDGYRVVTDESGIVLLDICSRDAVYTALLSAVSEVASVVYMHSILPFGEERVRSALMQRQGETVLDLHGVVPEEFELYGDTINSMLFAGYEREILRLATKVVCVSAEMKRHFEWKYNAPPEKFIVCPIFSRPGSRAANSSGPVNPNSRPLVVYAGGTQKWQKIPMMAQATEKIRKWADYVYMTPDPDGLRDALIKAGVPEWEASKNVYAAKHSDVLQKYADCQYGFILRDDITVNRVSCPTKLIEYLAYGIVPILDSEKVGDFAALGMQFVRLSDLVRDGFPPEDVRQEMVERNFTLIRTLSEMSREGLAILQGVINEYE